MTKVALDPRKRPRQARSAATVEAIVEAAAHILEEHGPEGFNTNAVARRAGVSIGSLYQYFPGKEALVAELSERAARALLDELDAAVRRLGGGGLAQDVSALIAAGVAWEGRRPALARALDRLEDGLNLWSDARGTAPAIRARIVVLLAPYATRLAPAVLNHAAEDALAIVRALFDAASGRGEPIDAALERRALAAVMGQLAAVGLRNDRAASSFASG